MSKIRCVVCLRSFAPRTHNGLMCSDECRTEKDRADRRIRKAVRADCRCIVCCKVFTPRWSKQQKLCSEACKKRRSSEMAKARWLGIKASELPKIKRRRAKRLQLVRKQARQCYRRHRQKNLERARRRYAEMALLTKAAKLHLKKQEFYYAE